MSREQDEGKHLESLSKQQLIEVLAAIERTLECGVCLECIRDTAVTCNNGHGVCTACAKGLQACPTCRAALFAVKSTMLKSVISLIPRPCRYSSNGCKTTIIPSSEKHHESYCGYRDIICYCNMCQWRGISNHLLEHLKCDHANILLTANNPVVKWPVIVEYKPFNVPVYAFDYIMWLRVWLDPDSLIISIRYHKEQAVPSHLAVISVKKGDIELTDAIKVRNFSKSSESTGLWKTKMVIPSKIANFFSSLDAKLVHSLKIVKEGV